jgi:hypothetical protein
MHFRKSLDLASTTLVSVPTSPLATIANRSATVAKLCTTLRTYPTPCDAAVAIDPMRQLPTDWPLPARRRNV